MGWVVSGVFIFISSLNIIKDTDTSIKKKPIIIFFSFIVIFSFEDRLVIYKIMIIMPLKKTIINIYLIQVDEEAIAIVRP